MKKANLELTENTFIASDINSPAVNTQRENTSTFDVEEGLQTYCTLVSIDEDDVKVSKNGKEFYIAEVEIIDIDGIPLTMTGFCFEGNFKYLRGTDYEGTEVLCRLIKNTDNSVSIFVSHLTKKVIGAKIDSSRFDMSKYDTSTRAIARKVNVPLSEM